MRRIFLYAILTIAAFANHAYALDIPFKSLTYNVNWRWGLVDKNMGTAQVDIFCYNNTLEASLTGKSIPWEGRVYEVADTLQARMKPGSSRIDYMIGWYRKPEVGSLVDPFLLSQYKNTLGHGELSADPETMEAVNIMANMLNIYYYAQALNFEKMTPGTVLDIPLYYGRDCQMMQLTFVGKNMLEYNEFNTYEVTVEYSYGGKLSGIPIHVEIAADTRLPMLISADIRIGHVEMELI